MQARRLLGLRWLGRGMTVALALTAILALAGAASADPPKEDAKGKKSNRLARESSPYLLQHAHNPVDWYPWGPEAFAKAKADGKLVFLSIGYSSCHWCHVMERESFANEEVARILNKGFVCIKVDREERPDIDTVYMAALHVLGQRGGWPLSMFLTADGKPIVGGTYWPPEDRQADGETIRGFKSVLKIMQEVHAQKPKELGEQAEAVADATRKTLGSAVPGQALVDLNRDLVTGATTQLRDEFDPEHGGFGNPQRGFRGTKFPTPPYLGLLLSEAARTNSGELLKMATITLDRMAEGGIYDHLGGGFHRYSTERTWTVPHFEKMLYDNGQLVELYARAFAVTKKPLYARIVKDSIAFVQRELTSPDGAFYSALDADSEGEEGKFYVWTNEELTAALPKSPDAGHFRKAYGADAKPNFESKFFILTARSGWSEVAKTLGVSEAELAERLAPMRRKLLEERGRRPRPFLDTKILAGWNGEMIAGLAGAGAALKEKSYTDSAARAADFVLAKMRTPEGRLMRTYSAKPNDPLKAQSTAFLDDYAYFIHGLLSLHEATQSKRWLDEANRLAAFMIEDFGDLQGGGFYLTSNTQEKLFARCKDQYDGAQPSGNSMAVRDLIRLARLTGEEKYRTLAVKALTTFAPVLKTNPTSMTTMAESLALHLDDQQPKEGLAGIPQLEGKGQAKPTKSDGVVKIAAKAEKPDASGKQVVLITIKIDKGWHIYANPPGLEDLEPVQTTVAFMGKSKPEKVNLEYPAGKQVTDAVVGKYKVYEDEVVLKAIVQRAAGDTSPLEATIKLQGCNDKQCLLPATIKVAVKE